MPVGYAAPAGWLPPKPRPPAQLVPQPNAARPEDLTFPDWTWSLSLSLCLSLSLSLRACVRLTTTSICIMCVYRGRATAGSPPTFDPPEGYWLAPDPKGGDTYAVPSGVSYSAEPGGFSERAAEWREPTTGHVHAFHGGYWGNWIFEIAAHDWRNRTIYFGAGGSQEARGSTTGGAFFVENIRSLCRCLSHSLSLSLSLSHSLSLSVCVSVCVCVRASDCGRASEELDHPGEYFVDRSTNELFLFYPAPAGTPPPPEAVAVPAPYNVYIYICMLDLYVYFACKYLCMCCMCVARSR